MLPKTTALKTTAGVMRLHWHWNIDCKEYPSYMTSLSKTCLIACVLNKLSKNTRSQNTSRKQQNCVTRLTISTIYLINKILCLLFLVCLLPIPDCQVQGRAGKNTKIICIWSTHVLELLLQQRYDYEKKFPFLINYLRSSLILL